MCISIKFSDDADDAGPGTTLRSMGLSNEEETRELSALIFRAQTL